MQRPVLEQEGRTVEEAVAVALERLGVSAAEVETEVLGAGSPGFLGFGSRPALVRVTVLPQKPQLVEAVVGELLERMGFDCALEVETDDSAILVALEGERSGLLIGRHGQTLNALQYLVNIMVGRASSDRRRVVMDVAGYRSRRQKSLELLARKMAARARRHRQAFTLDPMPAHERRLVHLALQGADGVTTGSQGREPFRAVVITPVD